MNFIKINKFTYLPNNKIELPASKSISNRLLIINELSDNKIQLQNLSDADDTKLLQNILNELKTEKDSYIFNVKNAGTTLRFLTAFLSIRKGEYTLLCDERMKKRPISELVDALNKLGANISYLEKSGFPPLKITGNPKLTGGKISINGSQSSQFISALMMIAPTLPKGLTIEILKNITSFPYIKITAYLLEKQGINVKIKKNLIQIAQQKFQPQNSITVESDWSAAAVWYAFATLLDNENLFLKNLHKNSIQGDKKLIEIYQKLGIKSIQTSQGIIIKKTLLNTDFFEINLRDNPDLMPTLAVNLCLLNIKFKIKGIENLKIKESNRISAITKCLKSFGYTLNSPDDDILEWDGNFTKKNFSGLINTENDHRIAMACSLLATKHNIKILDFKCVEKSYPKFWIFF